MYNVVCFYKFVICFMNEPSMLDLLSQNYVAIELLLPSFCCLYWNGNMLGNLVFLSMPFGLLKIPSFNIVNVGV